MKRSARSRRPTVVVAPSDYRAGPWACRSLARAGYRVVGAHTEGLGAGGRSLACPRPRRYPSPLEGPGAFAEALAGIVAREGAVAVLPASEDVVRVLSPHVGDLGAAVIGPDRDQYRRLCDKGELGATARACGVDHPLDAVVGAGDPEGPLPPLPSVVKPRVSGEGMHGSAAATTVRTPGEREAAVRELRSGGRDALVQELLEGPRWFAHSVGNGADFRFIAFRALDDYPRGSGPASFLRTEDEPPPGMRDATRRLVESVGYAGPCSLSFIQAGERLLVHDVNLRLGATVGASIRAGFDLPRLAVDLALGRPLPPVPARWRPTTYVRLDGELGAAVDELRGRGTGQRPAALVGRALRGLVQPRWMVDPSPLDPFVPGGMIARGLLSTARAQRQRVGAHPRRHAKG